MSTRRAAFTAYLEVELGLLAQLRELNACSVEAEWDELSLYGGGEDEGIENFAAEAWEKERVGALSHELVILGLYPVAELMVKIPLAWHLGEHEIRKTYKVGVLRQTLRCKFDVDIRTIPGYWSIDELRLVSNAIKHNGKVSKELAQKYSNWTEGALLTSLGATYDRLAPGVRLYVMALASHLD
jgi:hypothetical protein